MGSHQTYPHTYTSQNRIARRNTLRPTARRYHKDAYNDSFSSRRSSSMHAQSSLSALLILVSVPSLSSLIRHSTLCFFSVSERLLARGVRQPTRSCCSSLSRLSCFYTNGFLPPANVADALHTGLGTRGSAESSYAGALRSSARFQNSVGIGIFCICEQFFAVPGNACEQFLGTRCRFICEKTCRVCIMCAGPVRERVRLCRM